MADLLRNLTGRRGLFILIALLVIAAAAASITYLATRESSVTATNWPHIVKVGERCGLIDRDGRYVVLPRFHRIYRFNAEGLASASMEERINSYGLINRRGEFIAQPQYGFIYPYDASGLAAVNMLGDRGHRWSVIDRQGRTVIAETEGPVFFERFGLARASRDGRFGVINTTGRFIVEPVYDDVRPYDESGLAEIILQGKRGFVDRNGRIVVNPRFDGRSSGSRVSFGSARLAPAGNGSRWGYIDRTGNFVIPPDFERTLPFDESGMGQIHIGGRIGFVDEQGIVRVSPQWEEASSFDESGLAAVRRDTLWGFINRRGEVVIEPQFVGLFTFRDQSLTPVQIGSPDMGEIRYDSDGRAWRSERVTARDRFGNVRRYAVNGAPWGYIDRTGRLVIPPQYEEAAPFDESGLAAVKMGGRWGFIDRNGRTVIQPQFDDIACWDFPRYYEG